MKFQSFTHNFNRWDKWVFRVIAILTSLILWLSIHGGKKTSLSKEIHLEYIAPEGFVISNQPVLTITVKTTGPKVLIEELRDSQLTAKVEIEDRSIYKLLKYSSAEMIEGVFPNGLNVESINPSEVEIQLDLLETKSLPVRAVFEGSLPEGFKVKSVTLSPSSVTIQGPRSKLSNIESVPIEPITLSTNSLRQEFDVNLDLNDLSGVSTQETKVVHVLTELEGKLARRWFRGIPLGVKSKVSSGAVDVNYKSLGIRVYPKWVDFQLEGPVKVISQINKSDLRVWTELPEMKEGTYESKLLWKMPPDVRVVERRPKEVRIIVPPALEE